MRLPVLGITAAFIVVSTASGQSNTRLRQLFTEYYEDSWRESPELATQRDRTDYNDHWIDWSRAAIEQRANKRREYLSRASQFLRLELPQQDAISARLMTYVLEREIDTDEPDVYLLRFGPVYIGMHTVVYRTVDSMPRNTVKDFENIIARLIGTSAYVDQNIALLTEGIGRGLVQPRVVVDRLIEQLRAQAAQDASQTALLAAFRSIPTSISERERQRVSKQATAAYNQMFIPAWRRLIDFIVQVYAPKSRSDIGLTSVPNGKRLYAAIVRAMTTTALTPNQIHDLGIAEVDRIERDMLTIAREAGFQGSLSEFEQKLARSPDQTFRTKEEMLAYCRNAAKIAEPELPRLFNNIPRLLYGIRVISPDMEASTASNAQSPSQDVLRPGGSI